MRKTIVFGVCGLFMAVFVGSAHAAKETISMGTFDVPLVAGKDGCTPEVTVTDKNANGCYTTTIQKKVLQNGSCVNDGGAIERTTCDGAKGDDGNDGCYEVYDSSSGWGTEDFNLSIKWCCGGNDNCQEMTDSYPATGSYTSYSSAWIAQNCSSTFDTTPIANGYTVIVKNPCYGTETSYDITGEVGESANITSVNAEYTPYPQSTGNAGNPAAGVSDRQGYMTLTITYRNNTISVHKTPDSCDTYTERYDSGEHSGEYYQVKVCKDAQGSSESGFTPEYSEGGTYKFAYDTPAGTLSLADVANKVPQSKENLYKGPDMSDQKPGYKYKRETYPDGTTDEIPTEYDSPEEIVRRITDPSTGVVSTLHGKRYTCGGKNGDVCTSTGVKYCFGISAPTGADCINAQLVGEALDDYLLKEDQVEVNIIFVGQKLYYCKAPGCQDHRPDEDPEDPTWPNYWTELEITALQGAQGDSCAFVKSYSNPTNVGGTDYYWYKCCGTTFATCTVVTDTALINKLEDSVCQVHYTHKYLIDNGTGTPTESDTKTDDAFGERVIMTNTCNGDTENLDSIYGADGQGFDPCDGLTEAEGLSRVHYSTTVYVPHDPSGASGTTTGIGYSIDTVSMCNSNGDKTLKKYDHCELVSPASGTQRTVASVTCSGNETLLQCTAQQGNSTYYVCVGAEVSGYPKLKYVAPTESYGKFTEEGYTRWVHKHVSGGAEIDGDVNLKDTCHPVYKLNRTNSNNTVTTTTESVRKCQIQSPGTSGFTADEWYCLNTTNNVSTSCNGYSDSIVDDGANVDSTTIYYTPPQKGTINGSNVLIKYGYVTKVTKFKSGQTDTVDTPDECDRVQKITRTASDSTVSVQTNVVERCKVSTYDELSEGATGSWTAGAFYCLRTDASGTCEGYIEDPEQTLTVVYVPPVVDSNNKPTTVGYLKTNVTDNRLAWSGNSTYETNIRKDQGHKAYKYVNGTRQEIIKYTVQEPGGTSPFVTGYEYCLGKTEAECKEYSSEDPCADVLPANMGIAVKKVKSRTYARSNNSQGTLESVYEMCDGNDHTETTPDECKEMPKPASGSGSDCTGAWMQCDDQTKTTDKTYNYCDTGATSIFSAISLAQATANAAAAGTDPCATLASNATNEEKKALIKKTTRTYHEPTTTAPGYTSFSRETCLTGTTVTDQETDKCSPVSPADPADCLDGVYYACSNPNYNNGSTYYYCDTSTVNLLNSCADVATLSVAVKAATVKKIKSRTYARSNNSQGTLESVYEMCDGNDHTETTPDECKEMPKPASGSGSDCTGAWMQCDDQTKTTDKTYNYCDTGATSIFGAISLAQATDPCAAVANNPTLAAKTVKSTQYEYVTKGASSAGVGYGKTIKTMCDDTQSVPHKEEEIVYDTCEVVENDNSCLAEQGLNYRCYNQTKAIGDFDRDYKTCNPNADADSIVVAHNIDNKLNKDVTFSIKPNNNDNNKDYITISGTGIADIPIVAKEDLKGDSILAIWQMQQTDNTECQILFEKDCNQLGAADMLQDLSAYGNWARETYEASPSTVTHNDITAAEYQNSQKPCQQFTISEKPALSNGDRQYTLTCVQ